MFGITFLLDLKRVNDDLSAFRVNLFAVNQFVSWVIIAFPVEITSPIEFVWKKIVVSSAKSLTLPLVHPLGKSFMNNRKNRGPRTDPCGTPHDMGRVFDLHLSI